MIPIYPTLSFPNTLATFMVASTAVSDQFHSLKYIYTHHNSVADSYSFAKSTDGHLQARGENMCPTPWQTPSSSLESSTVSTITATKLPSHFHSSKRHGPSPTGIYEHLSMNLHRPSSDFSKLGSNLIAPATLPVFLDFAG